jgi:hypothetical protein
MTYLRILSLLFLLSCTRHKKLDVTQDLLVCVKFEQSFATPIELIVQKNKYGRRAALISYMDMLPTEPVSADTVILTSEQLSRFARFVDEGLLSKRSEAPPLGLGVGGNTDGGQIHVYINNAGRKNYFLLEGVDKESRQEIGDLLGATFTMMEENFGRRKKLIEENKRLIGRKGLIRR